jgi:hypothetical protein
MPSAIDGGTPVDVGPFFIDGISPFRYILAIRKPGCFNINSTTQKGSRYGAQEV